MKFKIRLSAEIFDFPNLYEESVEIEKSVMPLIG